MLGVGLALRLRVEPSSVGLPALFGLLLAEVVALVLVAFEVPFDRTDIGRVVGRTIATQDLVQPP